ncbi:hypothetical protein [Stenotrophomonas maltophilia]|jgi:hypothetical protein|uniref:hypothetical protein n=1 Tax=Stenotrophomonas maltophilia TaxID=40324 RepID=UPI0013D93114|nr:hypothetical protein [Stenotrophomonas maltophilia]MCX3877557.1 hypothetical protein [Stenotrophomonas maltophilia]
MLFKKPIKTIRSATPKKTRPPLLVVFSRGIAELKPAQKASMKQAAASVSLSRGFAETHTADEGRPNIFARKR